MIIGVSRENRGLVYKFDCVVIYFVVVMVLYWTKCVVCSSSARAFS